MESPPEQVVIEWTTTIEVVYDDGFVMEAPRGKWIVPDHGLKPGDRVKITITKEPVDAQE